MLREHDIAGQVDFANHEDHAGEAEGVTARLQPTRSVPPPSPPLIARLMTLQRARVHVIGMQQKCDRSCDSYIARHLGNGPHLTKAQQQALFAEAAAMRTDVEKQLRKEVKKSTKSRGQCRSGDQGTVAPDGGGGEGQGDPDNHHDRALSVCLPVIAANYESRRPWDRMRGPIEQEMRSIARGFPVWLRAQQVAGFADLGLAVLVAEAGNDLSAYPHWYMLWKRLGLAPYNGRAMSSWGKNQLTPEEWTECGYRPERRGRIAGDIGTALFMKKARNGYGAVYTARRERTALTHPEWTKKHSDNDARRIMLKALVKDVWIWWQATHELKSVPATGAEVTEGSPFAAAAD